MLDLAADRLAACFRERGFAGADFRLGFAGAWDFFAVVALTGLLRLTRASSADLRVCLLVVFLAIKTIPRTTTT